MRRRRPSGKLSITFDEQSFNCAWQLAEDGVLTITVYSTKAFFAKQLQGVSRAANLDVLARACALGLLRDESSVQTRTVATRATGIRVFRAPAVEDRLQEHRSRPLSIGLAAVARLMRAEAHVASAAQRIVAARNRIDARLRNGLRTTEAASLLARMIDAQALMSAHYERLREESEKPPPWR